MPFCDERIFPSIDQFREILSHSDENFAINFYKKSFFFIFFFFFLVHVDVANLWRWFSFFFFFAELPLESCRQSNFSWFSCFKVSVSAEIILSYLQIKRFNLSFECISESLLNISAISCALSLATTQKCNCKLCYSNSLKHVFPFINLYSFSKNACICQWSTHAWPQLKNQSIVFTYWSVD